MHRHLSRAISTDFSSEKLESIPEVDQVVDKHDTEIEEIAASFLDIKLPSIFESRSEKYQTNLPFKGLIQFYEELLQASKALKSKHKAFQKSKKEEESEEDGKAPSGTYVWSMSKLAKLLQEIENVQSLIAFRSDPDSGLLTICTGSGDNIVCWNTQGNVAKVIKALKKRVNKINTELADFFLSNGKFREELLYLEPDWERSAIMSGAEYIVNVEDDNERYWIGRDGFDPQTPTTQLTEEEMEGKV